MDGVSEFFLGRLLHNGGVGAEECGEVIATTHLIGQTCSCIDHCISNNVSVWMHWVGADFSPCTPSLIRAIVAGLTMGGPKLTTKIG